MFTSLKCKWIKLIVALIGKDSNEWCHTAIESGAIESNLPTRSLKSKKKTKTEDGDNNNYKIVRNDSYAIFKSAIIISK